MKKVIGVILFSLIAVMAFAVDYADVVEKKDGSILKGVIIENKINDFVKIELAGGSVFKIDYNDIDSIKKEKIVVKGSSDQIIINNNNNASSSASSSSSGTDNEIQGYTLIELNQIFRGLKFDSLKRVSVDENLMNKTDISIRSEAYNQNRKGNVTGYVLANLAVPGLGSLIQGDTTRGITSIIVNAIGWIIYYSAYVSYLDTIANYNYDTYSYDDGSTELAIMVGSGLFLFIWDLVQLSRPRKFRDSYNNQLETKLSTNIRR